MYYSNVSRECARLNSSAYIRNMKTTFIFPTLLALTLSCSNSAELMPEQLALVSTGAGMLARNLAYMPGDSNWSKPPEAGLLAELEAMAEDRSDIWPLFFRAAADSAAKLDQLEMQARQEAVQAELL
jgi:hypothetical protein